MGRIRQGIEAADFGAEMGSTNLGRLISFFCVLGR